MTDMPGSDKSSRMPPLSTEEKKKFCDLAKFLSRAVWQAQAFGIEHPLAKQPIEQCFNLLDKLIQEKGGIILHVAEKKLRYGDTALEENNLVVDRLVELFSTIRLVSLEFKSGFSLQDFLKLLSVLSMRLQDIQDSGGIEKLIEEKNIEHFKLNPIKYELIGMDEKVVSSDKNGIKGDLRELEKKLSQWQIEPGAQAQEAEEESAENLLSLIDESLKEGTDQSAFIDKLIEDPLEQVYSIMEAIRLVNKVGGEKAKTLITSVINKLDGVRDSLYMRLAEGREDEDTEYIYRSAGILGKELNRQLKTLSVSDDLNSLVEGVANVLNMILDQTEAKKMLALLLKGNITLKKKADFLKKVTHRKKTSPDFEFMIRKLLTLKGVSEDEVTSIFEQKVSILEEAEQEREAAFIQKLKPALQKLSEKQINVEDMLSELNQSLSQTVNTQVKIATQKLKQEKENLAAQAEVFNAAFGDLDEGAMVFDEKGNIIFINEPARQLMGPEKEKALDEELLRSLKNWQPAKASNLDEFLSQNKINEARKTEFVRIFSNLKTIRKNKDGQLSIAIFKPLPQNG